MIVLTLAIALAATPIGLLHVPVAPEGDTANVEALSVAGKLREHGAVVDPGYFAAAFVARRLRLCAEGSPFLLVDEAAFDEASEQCLRRLLVLTDSRAAFWVRRHEEVLSLVVVTAEGTSFFSAAAADAASSAILKRLSTPDAAPTRSAVAMWVWPPVSVSEPTQRGRNVESLRRALASHGEVLLSAEHTVGQVYPHVSSPQLGRLLMEDGYPSVGFASFQTAGVYVWPAEPAAKGYIYRYSLIEPGSSVVRTVAVEGESCDLSIKQATNQAIEALFP